MLAFQSSVQSKGPIVKGTAQPVQNKNSGCSDAASRIPEFFYPKIRLTRL